MKRSLILILLLPIFSVAQNFNPQFADDVIISNFPDRNQEIFTICPGYDSSLYCSYGYYYQSDNQYYLCKSIDNGLTWSVLLDAFMGLPHYKYLKRKMVSFGNSSENFHLARAELRYDSINNYQAAEVYSFLPSCELISMLFSDGRINDIDIASDNLYPHDNSSIGSFAYVFSKTSLLWPDSLILRTCTDGGFYFDRHFSIRGSSKNIVKVGVAYGRSKTYNTGRYFVVWEEKESIDDAGGKIYVSHQISDINSNFCAPVCLNDFFDPETPLTNPRIACQYNDLDNNQSDLSVIVLTEKHDISGTSIIGFYNNSAIKDTTFEFFTIGDPDHNFINSNIIFNPLDSAFKIVYFDSINKKIPYLVNDYKLANPANWIVVSECINDNNDVSSPNPQLTICYGEEKGGVVWTSDRQNGNKYGLFDAENHFYAKVNESEDIESGLVVYPNPSSGKVYFKFKDQLARKIEIFNLLNENVLKINCNTNLTEFDLTNNSSGLYYYKISSNNKLFFGTFIINK